VSAEGVVHNDIVFVTDHDAHIVFDADEISENVEVADVAVAFFSFKIELIQTVARGDLQGEGIFFGFFTAFCAEIGAFQSAFFGIDFDVEFKKMS
jgi:hypothetical protein